MNTSTIRLLVAATACLAASVIPGYAQQEPPLLPFQGRLTDQNGTPVSNGLRFVQFKIYDVPAGGTPSFTELHRATVNGGLVNVILGTKSLLPTTNSLGGLFFNQTLYLEITVDLNNDNLITTADPPLLPRQAILPVVFAKDTAKLAGHDWSSILVSGNNPATGKIRGSKINPLFNEDTVIFDKPGGAMRVTKLQGQLSSDDLGIWHNAGAFLIADWDTGTKGISVNTSSGYIGIGTPDAGAPLTIQHEASYSFPNPGRSAKGAINIRATTSNRQTGITFSRAGVDDAQAGIYVHQDDSGGTRMHFATTQSYSTGPQTRVTVFNNGRVGIGTTNPTATLDVRSDLSAGFLRLTNAGFVCDIAPGLSVAPGYACTIGANTGIAFSSVVRFLFSPNFFSVPTGTGSQLLWNSSGDVVRQTSSKRFKENIQMFRDDFSKMLLLHPKLYTRPSTPHESEIGYIAEEVEEVGLKHLVIRDAQGRPDGLDYSKMVLYSNEILKEHRAKLESQRAEIESLKSELTVIKHALQQLLENEKLVD